MRCNLLYNLMRKAVEEKIFEIDADWIKLADSKAVGLLDGISEVLDSPYDSDEKVDKITKMIALCEVGQRNRPSEL